jgi:electron transport complex protein RnfC
MKRVKGIPFPSENGRFGKPEIKTLPLPERIILPLISKFGEMTPIIAKGDHVRVGQVIAKGPQKWVPPILASVTGKIASITTWSTGNGQEGPAVIIESPKEEMPPERTHDSEEDLPERMRWIQAGDIRETDSSSLPVALRLRKPELVPSAFASASSALAKPIHTLIINGIDRQPGVWLRKAMVGLHEQDMLDAVAFFKKATGASRIIFAVLKGTELGNEFLRGLGERGAEVVCCPNTYPIGLEPLLVPFLTGQELPASSAGAREFGTLVVDVTTALKVAGTARGGTPSLEVVVQITAPSAGVDTLVRVRQGTLIEDILTPLSIPRRGLAKVVCGGPFLGIALHRLDIPITQETDSILLQTEQETVRYSDEPCVSCGYCVRHCPMKLMPNELSKNCEYGKFDVAERMDIFSCIECGICAYVCPVNRPMVQLICFGKREIEAARNES